MLGYKLGLGRTKYDTNLLASATAEGNKDIVETLLV